MNQQRVIWSGVLGEVNDGQFHRIVKGLEKNLYVEYSLETQSSRWYVEEDEGSRSLAFMRALMKARSR